jgi:mannonate dehydratase
MSDILMRESLRWFGPKDPVSLSDIRQCGAGAVITSLHEIPYGELWSVDAIHARKAMIERAGLSWAAVESVPVHEDIKTRTGRFAEYIDNYKQTLRNLAACGIKDVIYNFMPVLDWVRTDICHKLPDGTECMHYDPVKFAAFELYFLKRPEAAGESSADQLAKAKAFYESLSREQAASFERTIIDVFPGCKLGLGIEDIRAMLAKYDNISPEKLKEHLRLFLREVGPVADELGTRLSIHADDPPFSIMGLPRIVSSDTDLSDIIAMYDGPSNGLCFCCGSLSPRKGNDICAMIAKYADRINIAHLRNTQINEDGTFYEADHLHGSIDMYAAVLLLLEEMNRRRDAGRADWQIIFRPDHGHNMLDDIGKTGFITPGYTAIGRLKGLSEIRGLQLGISKSIF